MKNLIIFLAALLLVQVAFAQWQTPRRKNTRWPSRRIFASKMTRLVTFLNETVTNTTTDEFDGLLTRPIFNSWTLNSSRFYVNLVNRSIRSLDDGLFTNTSVYSLVLRGNKIETLEAGYFSSLTTLWNLDLSGNKLSKLASPALDQLSTLFAANFSLNQISSVGDSTFKLLSFLTTLDLSSNQLESMPDSVFQSNHNLKFVYLNNNHLSKVPQIGSLSFLRLLNLANNQIERIEDQAFAKFSHLQMLGLSDNKIKYMSVEQFNENCLIDLRFDSNPIESDITKTKSSFGCIKLTSKAAKADEPVILRKFDGILTTDFLTQWGLYQNRSFARLLPLSGKKITTIKIGVFDDFKKLNYLHLENNSIADLDIGLFQPRRYSLLEIYLNNNKLTSIDEELFSGLEKLQVLSLSSNSISSVDSFSFSSLKNLAWLYLDSNELESLSQHALAGLSNLKHLDLSNNNIKRITYLHFSSLTSLTYLTLASNALKELDKGSFDELKNLVRLDLSENNLDSLAPWEKLNELCLQEFNMNSNRMSDLTASYDESKKCFVIEKTSKTSTTTVGPVPYYAPSDDFATYTPYSFRYSTTTRSPPKKVRTVSTGVVMFILLTIVGLVFFSITVLAFLHQRRQLPSFIQLS